MYTRWSLTHSTEARAPSVRAGKQRPPHKSAGAGICHAQISAWALAARQTLQCNSFRRRPTPEKIESPGINNTSTMDYVYLYCLSNEAMPGIIRIGVSNQTPDQVLNTLNCEHAPHDYKLMVAKKVFNPMEKLNLLRNLMSMDRTHPNRDFFRTPYVHVEALFGLMYGETWVCRSDA